MSVPIYLDYNATTPIAPEVAEEILPYIWSHFGNPSSSYAIGRHNKEAIEKARMQVAGLIRAKPEEIIFTSGGTESNNHAIRGAVFANSEKGKHIITSQVEHPAVTEVCRYLESLGWEITYLPVDKFGAVRPDDVERAVREETVLITIMHANNEVGTIQPIKEIGEPVLKAMNTDRKTAAGTVRISTGKFTTKEEIDHAVEAISTAVNQLSHTK